MLDLLDDSIFREDILTCWTNSTKMRRWLLHQKALVAEKLEYQEDSVDKEVEIIQDMIGKVVEKAEILTLL